MKKLIVCFIYLVLNLSVQGQITASEAKDTIRQIKIEKGHRYLNLPISESNRLTKARVLYEGKLVDEFTFKLASGKPDYWTFFDVTPYQGKTISVEISKDNIVSVKRGSIKPEDIPKSDFVNMIKGLNMIFADSKFPGEDSLYKELNRPQVHFTSQRGWVNDANGLIYYNGRYHLFFQHNPYGWGWGNMHWGHAISTDLLHWEQLPEAIYPYNSMDLAYSGSAVTDKKNTAAFRKNGIDPLIAIYTSTARGECLKMSYDNGKTFKDYEGNPILVHKGRDPKVFWYEPGNMWVMVVFDEGKTEKIALDQEGIIDQNLIYTSPDLKKWTFQSGVRGFHECPELFQLPVDGESGTSKWIMYDASGRYQVGDFNGKKFSSDQHFKTYAFGGGYFFASQTFNNTPDNRRVQIGWGRNIIYPGMPFNQLLLFPTELKLKKTSDGFTLCPTPIKEINSLHKNAQIIENKVLTFNNKASVPVKDDAVHIIAQFAIGDAEVFLMDILGYKISYSKMLGQIVASQNITKNTIYYKAPESDKLKVEVIADKGIIEIFINDGEIYYVAPFQGEKKGKVEVYTGAYENKRTTTKKAILKKLEVYELNSIWNKATH